MLEFSSCPFVYAGIFRWVIIQMVAGELSTFKTECNGLQISKTHIL